MSDQANFIFEFGNFRMDARTRTLTRLDGEPATLTPKLFDTLLYLVENAGETLDKDRLMSALWPDLVVEENNLSQAISNLRRMLGDDGTDSRYIVTVPRRGYRFVADVRRGTENVAPPVVLQAASAIPANPAVASVPGKWVGFTQAALKRWLLVASLVVIAAAIVGAEWWRRPAAGMHGTGNKSIAVLPFVNSGNRKDDEFFGDGITEDLVNQLAQISDLKVVSRTSTIRYKGSTKSLRDIARELGVAYILEGSIRRSDQRFRINAQLIDAERDEHVWARTYDRDNQDILAVQSQVTTEIVGSLKARLLAAEKAQLEQRARGNSEAYVWYLKGKHVFRTRTRVNLAKDEYDQAPSFFLKVIELDPTSPLGYEGMATYHLYAARLGFVPPKETYAKAEGYLLKALALDNQSADVYSRLAELRGLAQKNWPEAEKAAKRAIELNPNDAAAWNTYRIAFLEPTGRLAEAITAQKRAVSLDPTNSYYLWQLALLYVYAGDCAEAMRQTRANIELDPDYSIHHTLMVNCLEKQGKFREAIAESRLVKGYWVNEAFLNEQEKAFALHGPAGYWRAQLKHQKQLVSRRNDSRYFTAVAAVAAGETDEAFRQIDAAIDAYDRNVVYLKIDPAFDTVRNDERYRAALKRLHLD